MLSPVIAEVYECPGEWKREVRDQEHEALVREVSSP
jgi:hypothetical protein